MTRAVNFRRRAFGAAIAASVALVAVVSPAGASDATVAQNLVITKRDVGSGYAESKTTPTPDAFAKLATCVGRPALNRKVLTDVQGSEFGDSATGSVIFSSVEVVKSSAMARKDRSVLGSSKFPNCVAQLLSSSPAAAAHLSGISAHRVTVKHFGDYSTAVLVQATGSSAAGQPISITQIQVGISKGRAEVSAGFTTPGTQPFDRAAAEAILAKVDDRLNRANLS